MSDISGQGAAQWPQPCCPTRRNGWFQAQAPGRLVLARHWPARFDFMVELHLPCAPGALRLGRLARQVRQDLWRALRDLRGFSPVIQIVAQEEGVLLQAGGRLATTAMARHATHIATLSLSDPARQARWLAWAGRAR